MKVKLINYILSLSILCFSISCSEQQTTKSNNLVEENENITTKDNKKELEKSNIKQNQENLSKEKDNSSDKSKDKNSPKDNTNTKEKKDEYLLKLGKLKTDVYTVKPNDNVYTIAKKNKIYYKNLMKLNNLKSPYLYIGDKVILNQNLIPSVSDKYTGIIVNIPKKHLYYFNEGKIDNSYTVTVGLPNIKWQTPTGEYTALYKREAPVWKIPKSIQEEMEAKGEEVKTEIPPGPNNPLGKWWIGLTWKGLGIHSTNNPRSIGYSVSHGCIRMSPKSAEEVFKKVQEQKTIVNIVYQPILLAIDENENVFIEIHKDIYLKKIDFLQTAKNMIKDYKLESKVSLIKLKQAVESKSGLPVNITEETPSEKSESKIKS